MLNTIECVISNEVDAGVAETGSLQERVKKKILRANFPSSECLFRCHTFLVILTGTHFVRSFRVFLGRDEGKHRLEYFKGWCLQQRGNFAQ